MVKQKTEYTVSSTYKKHGELSTYSLLCHACACILDLLGWFNIIFCGQTDIQ